MTHSGHFGHHTEQVDNSETQYFLKLLNVLTSHLEWKLQWTDSIGNSEKLLNSAHGLQTKETDKYTENTSRRIMLAMDTTGPLEYDLLGHGVLLIYIYLFVQKLTQNYNKRTSNKKKQDNGVNPSSQNGYKLLDRKQRVKNMVTRIRN